MHRLLTWLMIALCIFVFGYILKVKADEKCPMIAAASILQRDATVKRWQLFNSLDTTMILIEYRSGNYGVLWCREHWSMRIVPGKDWSLPRGIME